MINYKSITLKRTNDYIEFLNWRGVAVASLYDGHDHIIHEPFANSLHLFTPEIEPEIDYKALIEEQGLDVSTARMIDVMPKPD